jgi:hypothetical protein
MDRYKKLNILMGWVSFLIAATTYLLTIEPTVSLWDCGEFIASAYKLLVGHPPGAPFFMLTGRFFSLFAGNTENVAMMVNAMSALASAFTILFLFWSVTHLASKIMKLHLDFSTGKMIIVLGSGLVGALAFTFSDTFWFSAVEGEVYAYSSLFTALVFWAILKWENEADQKHANRWIILIGYLMGLSIGVHLLNLLAIPAIVLVYYFRKNKVTRNGLIGVLLMAMVLLGSLMYGIIPGMVSMASKFELIFVNSFGMGYKSGVFFYLLLLFGCLGTGIYATHYNKNENICVACTLAAIILLGIPFMSGNAFLNVLILGAFAVAIIYFLKKRREVLNAILLLLTVIVIGYSSFATIVIRSIADPPMDENNPDNVFALLSYLNREQYGDRPLVFGQYYSAPLVAIENGKPVYTQLDGKYVITDYKKEIEYHEDMTTLFPRMYSSDESHIREYQQWGKIQGRRVAIRNAGKTEQLIKPTFTENLRYFFRYQMGFMYWRYFMWNFSGRQNDDQSHGEMLNGNWITGIPVIDARMIGPQKDLPERFKNHPARNTYYMLPLLLGLWGFMFHMQKHRKDFVVVLFLFVLTGIAIVIYLNQTPLQPRERDYAYAGSFYAFSLWIGLGALALFDALRKLLPEKPRAVVSTLVCLALVPAIMAKENWDDHDRSGRYTTRDLARNYLESCAPNAILFTNGDNDTFPLWYAQEVEGIRTDVRVCNLMLLNTDWYIDQMKRKAYESDALPISMTKTQYLQGNRDVVFLMDQSQEYEDIRDIMQFIKSDHPQTKVPLQSGEKTDFVPTRNFKMIIDKEQMLQTGTVEAEDLHLIDTVIQWRVGARRLTKSDLAVLDILAHNNWERPIYFVSLGHSGVLSLNDYMQMDGFAYRLVPIRTPQKGSVINAGRVDTDILYENLMEKYTWGRMMEPDVLIDYYTARTFSVMQIRNKFLRLASELYGEGQEEKAIEVLDKGFWVMPDKKIPYDYFNLQMIHLYYELGQTEKAEKEANVFFHSLTDLLDYYTKLDMEYQELVSGELRMNAGILMQLQEVCKEHSPELSAKIAMKIGEYGLM